MKVLVRFIFCLLISFPLVHLPVLKAHAGMISTTEVVDQMTRSQGETTVAEFLNRDDVTKELIKIGVHSHEAEERIKTLSDAEVSKLARDIKKAQVGGDIGGILLIVFLVLGIVYFAKRI